MSSSKRLARRSRLRASCPSDVSLPIWMACAERDLKCALNTGLRGLGRTFLPGTSVPLKCQIGWYIGFHRSNVPAYHFVDNQWFMRI